MASYASSAPVALAGELPRPNSDPRTADELNAALGARLRYVSAQLDSAFSTGVSEARRRAASRYDDHDRCSPLAYEPTPEGAGEVVASVHGPPDDDLVCVMNCRQSQQLGGRVP
jgi:hypothetical protein